MDTKNNYVVKIFVPTEFTLTTECGFTETKLCKKNGQNSFIDLDSNKSYSYREEIGYIKVVKERPLSEYYYKIGLRKKNNYQDKDVVHELVQRAKTKRKL